MLFASDCSDSFIVFSYNEHCFLHVGRRTGRLNEVGSVPHQLYTIYSEVPFFLSSIGHAERLVRVVSFEIRGEYLYSLLDRKVGTYTFSLY